MCPIKSILLSTKGRVRTFFITTLPILNGDIKLEKVDVKLWSYSTRSVLWHQMKINLRKSLRRNTRKASEGHFKLNAAIRL